MNHEQREARLKALLGTSAVGEENSGLLQREVRPGILPILAVQPGGEVPFGAAGSYGPPYVMADLLPKGTSSSWLIRYMQEKTMATGAVGVGEGGFKPESTIEYDATDTSMRKFATLLPVTDEMLDDAPQLRSYLAHRLHHFVLHGPELDRQLLYGAGGDELDGLFSFIPLDNQDLFFPGGTALDAIKVAATKVRVSLGDEISADGIVMNPEDFDALQGMKTVNGDYVGGSPGEWMVGGKNLWGVPVVTTTAIPRGTALVGAFRPCAMLFVHEPAFNVDSTDSHDENFVKDITVIRAEQRVALVVFRPQGFATADVSDLVPESGS